MLDSDVLERTASPPARSSRCPPGTGRGETGISHLLEHLVMSAPGRDDTPRAERLGERGAGWPGHATTTTGRGRTGTGSRRVGDPSGGPAGRRGTLAPGSPELATATASGGAGACWSRTPTCPTWPPSGSSPSCSPATRWAARRRAGRRLPAPPAPSGRSPTSGPGDATRQPCVVRRRPGAAAHGRAGAPARPGASALDDIRPAAPRPAVPVGAAPGR